MSAAFDINENRFFGAALKQTCQQRLILMKTSFFEILAKRIGLQSVVLLFIKYYLSLRSQQIIISGCLSGDVKVKTGVPQGSVLSPLLFSCYMLTLEDKLNELRIKCHF